MTQKKYVLALLCIFSLSFCRGQVNQQKVSDTSKKGAKQSSEEFADFWQRFRGVLLARDSAALVELTWFPFETRGLGENDTVIRISKRAFTTFLALFLNQQTTLDTPTMPEAALIKKGSTPKDVFTSTQLVRVGDLVFRRIGFSWKLVLAYAQPDTIKGLAVILQRLSADKQ